MIYLAGPYSHDDPKIRQERFEALSIKASELMMMGFVVFSPITHGHAIAMLTDLPTDFKWWEHQCVGMLNHADKLIVLKLPGWEKSAGLHVEIKIAASNEMPIEWI